MTKSPTPDQKREALLPCHIAELESNIGYYDMPEAEPELMVSGWALVQLIDEAKRWRETHKSGEFNPDYCAASEALAEHLEELSKNGRPMAAIRIGQAVADLTRASLSPTDEETATLDPVQVAIILTHLDKMNVPEWMMKVIAPTMQAATHKAPPEMVSVEELRIAFSRCPEGNISPTQARDTVQNIIDEIAESFPNGLIINQGAKDANG